MQKLSNCDFYRDRIQYLGHIISKEGISVDPKKIEAIMNWPTPRNVTDVRSFIGIAGYSAGRCRKCMRHLLVFSNQI